MDKNELLKKIIYGTNKGIMTEHKLYPEFFDEVGRAKILNSYIHKEYLDDINQAAEGYRNKEINVLPWSLFIGFETSGNRLEYEKAYFEHRGRLMTFALMSWLYRKPSDILELEDIIWAICEEYTWALPAHIDSKSLEPTIDLFAAETAFALSEIIYMLGELLSPLIINRAKKEIFGRVLFAYLEYKGEYNWEVMKNNWCAVCAGSIGVTGIYLLEDDSLLAELLNRLSPTLERFLDSFEDDGACLEGLSYWTYGVSFYVAFADLLKRRTAGEVDLLNTKRFKKIAIFQHKCYFPGGWTVSFSDANTKDCYRTGLTSFLKRRFNEVQIPPSSSKAGYFFDPCFRWCNGIRDLLWTDEYIIDTSSETACHILPNAEWMLCKQYSGNQLSLAVKGGHNDEPHNHNDVGSFILYKDGECILTDLGSGEYTKDYFGEERYSIFCNSSLGHNVPIIDGNGQKEGKSFAAKDLVFHGNGRMTMDISDAYDNNDLVKLIRDITIHEDKVILIDTFELTKGIKSISERFVTLHKPTIMEGSVLIKAGKTECHIRYDSTNIKPLIQMHYHMDHEGKRVTVYSINFEREIYSDTVICIFEIQ
ncbi:MAG: hypothetical protein EWM47_00380 [Anaerolineaceae bacterium]|nr:MAG: hypothetical protein EWM47_00380 [Anaerolineaceae bacterium]